MPCTGDGRDAGVTSAAPDLAAEVEAGEEEVFGIIVTKAPGRLVETTAAAGATATSRRSDEARIRALAGGLISCLLL